MVDTIAQSGALPPITYLDIEKIKRENSYNHNIPITSALHMSAPPLISPSIYSGPPPPYSYPSSAASSVVGGAGSGPGAVGPGTGVGNYLSPAETRRTNGDDKVHPPASQRMSLPSISEALTGDQQQPISISSLLSSTTPQPKFSLIPKSPTTPAARSYLETYPKGPPDSFPQHTSSHTSSSCRPPQPSDRTSGSNYSPRMITSVGENRFSTTHPIDTHQPVPQPPRTIPSPSHYSRPGASPIQPQSNYVPPSPMHEKITRPVPPPASNPPFGYNVNNYQPGYSYPTTTPGVPSYRTPTLPPSTWRGTAPEIERVEEMRKATAKETSPPRPAYGESVKRHLDIFDLETSLNEIAEGSGRGLEFSRLYGTRAHQTQRSGPIPGSLPSLTECDEMIRQQTKVLDAMARIRDVICKQQQALVEQRNYDQQNYKAAPSEPDDNESTSYIDKLEGSGGFAGADAKKRRGRAAPPGRCHSCNRAETPEWRRGPDGARTLCNACGLHYAKLTRKMGPKASASSGSSNLRPKESSPQSP